MTRAEHRQATLTWCLEQLHLAHQTLQNWRQDERFGQLENSILRNPDVAANFLLAFSRPDAARALRNALDSGARVATDSARFILGERKRPATSGESVEALLDAALKRLEAGHST